MMDDESLVQISQNLLTCDDSDNWNDFKQFVYLDQQRQKAEAEFWELVTLKSSVLADVCRHHWTGASNEES